MATPNWDQLQQENVCYLTTRGRITGQPHTIEIWFALHEKTLYMLSGGRDRADWVRNIRQTPEVTVRIKDYIFNGNARAIQNEQEDTLARRLVYEKYAPQEDDLEDWRDRALPVAIDIIV